MNYNIKLKSKEKKPNNVKNIQKNQKQKKNQKKKQLLQKIKIKKSANIPLNID